MTELMKKLRHERDNGVFEAMTAGQRPGNEDVQYLLDAYRAPCNSLEDYLRILADDPWLCDREGAECALSLALDLNDPSRDELYAELLRLDPTFHPDVFNMLD